MPEDNCARDPNLRERLMDQLGLRLGGPRSFETSIATMAVSWAIKRDDAMLLGSKVDETARLKIRNHTAVTMQHTDRFPFPAVDVVEPNTVDFEKLADRRMVSLSPSRKLTVYESGDRQYAYGSNSYCGRAVCPVFRPSNRHVWRAKSS